jgi:hypothetical protein
VTGRGQAGACVFCGRPILPTEEASGRGDAAAHTACADRALADDRYWDAVASQKGEQAPEAPGGAPDVGRRGAGCALALIATLTGIAAIAAMRSLRPR